MSYLEIPIMACTRKKGVKFYNEEIKPIIETSSNPVNLLVWEDVFHIGIGFLDETVIKLIDNGYEVYIDFSMCKSKKHVLRKIHKLIEYRKFRKVNIEVTNSTITIKKII